MPRLTTGAFLWGPDDGQGSANSRDFADEVDHFNGVVSVQAKRLRNRSRFGGKAFTVRPLPVPNAGADQFLCEDFVTLDATRSLLLSCSRCWAAG